VEFEEARDAQAAMDNMNMAELYGRVIKCSMAKPIAIKEGSVRPSLLSASFPFSPSLLSLFLIYNDLQFGPRILGYKSML